MAAADRRSSGWNGEPARACGEPGGQIALGSVKARELSGNHLLLRQKKRKTRSALRKTITIREGEQGWTYGYLVSFHPCRR
jgi:hypothetical protein